MLQTLLMFRCTAGVDQGRMNICTENSLSFRLI